MSSSTPVAPRREQARLPGPASTVHREAADSVRAERGAKHELVYAAVLDLLARLPAGADVPSERELCTAHGVSRPTVRRALLQLEREGRITGHRGRRRAAAIAKVDLPLSLSSLSDDLRSQGIVPGTKLLHVTRLHPSADETARRALGTDREMMRVERLRLADGDPIALETLFVTADRFDDISADLGLGQSFYALLHHTYGIELGSAEETIEVMAADEHEAALLGIPPRTSVLLLSRRTVDRSGVPIEYVRSLYRANRFRLVAHLVPAGQPSPVTHPLRVARSADAAALARVFIAAWRTAYPDILDPDVLGRWEPAATEAWMRELISTPDEATVVALAPDGAISGFTRYGRDPDDPHRGYISSLYVDPAAKRRGVGATLVRHAIEALAGRGFRAVSLWVFEANAAARGLYTTLGFEPDGTGRIEPEFRAPEIRMVRGGDRSVAVAE